MPRAASDGDLRRGASGEAKAPTVPIKMNDPGPPVPGTCLIFSFVALSTPLDIVPPTSTLTPLPLPMPPTGPPVIGADEASTFNPSTRSDPVPV